MNEFLFRIFKIIRSQTGAGFRDCKFAFEQTHSIKGAINLIRNQPRKVIRKTYDGQVI